MGFGVGLCHVLGFILQHNAITPPYGHWSQEEKSMQQHQPHQSNMTHHAPQGGSSPAIPNLMQQHHPLHLHPGASRHPYAQQPHRTWENYRNVELNNNQVEQVGPLYPPFMPRNQP